MVFLRKRCAELIITNTLLTHRKCACLSIEVTYIDHLYIDHLSHTAVSVVKTMGMFDYFL